MKNKIIALAATGFLAVACGDQEGADVTTHAAPGTAGDFKANIKDRVFFSLNGHEITADAKARLAKQADWLKSYNSTKATVEGHCDARGTRDFNLALGNKRAEAAKAALVKLGVPADRLKTMSFGKDRLQVNGDSEKAHAQNRTAITVVE